MGTNISQRMERFETRMKCSLKDCGTHVTISASKDYLENIEQEKQVYSARCTRCGVGFKLKQTELEFFGRHFGQPKMQITSTTFNSLFDE